MNNQEKIDLVVAGAFTIGIIILVLLAQFMVFHGYTIKKTITPSQDSIKTFYELVAVTKYCKQFGDMQDTCVQKYYEYKLKSKLDTPQYTTCSGV